MEKKDVVDFFISTQLFPLQKHNTKINNVISGIWIIRKIKYGDKNFVDNVCRRVLKCV